MNAIAGHEEARILAITQEQHGILFEQLLGRLPELTWNQAFALVDGLSRRGMISLRRQGFEYELQVPSPSFGRPVPEHGSNLNGAI